VAETGGSRPRGGGGKQRRVTAEAATYGVAGVVYVAIGVLVPAFLFSWLVAAAYLLVAVWIVPSLVRKALR